MKKLELLWE